MKDAFSTPGGDEAIRDAIRAAEAETSGEIAVVIVPESDRYPEGALLGGVLLGGFTACVVCITTGHQALWSFVPLAVLLFFPWWFLFRAFPRLKFAFITRSRVAEAVRVRAVRAFHEKGLHRTCKENGVLVFLSLLERRIWILADRGIDGKVMPEEWRSIADDVSAGIRSGLGVEAVCTAVARCGEQLRRHFPRSPDDVNELPDEVLR